MYANTAYNTYQQNNVSIESPQKLIQMLYEGIMRFNVQAINSIKNNDIEKRTYWLNRSLAIFTELLNSLDPTKGGEVAEYLEGLYTYQMQLLSEANLENDIEKIKTVSKVVKGLLEAWRETNDLQ
jgi:flagellar protein FliS